MSYETQYTDEPICPHCGKSVSDAWEINFGATGDEETELECGHCEKPFTVSRRITVKYCTSKLKDSP